MREIEILRHIARYRDISRDIGLSLYTPPGVILRPDIKRLCASRDAGAARSSGAALSIPELGALCVGRGCMFEHGDGISAVQSRAL